MPLASVAFSAAFLHETITAGHITGMALVLCGIYLIAFKGAKRTKAKDIA